MEAAFEHLKAAGHWAYNRATFGNIASTVGTSLGIPAAIGFAGARGDLRGAPAGIWGGFKGEVSGALKGGLFLGIAGAGLGAGLTMIPGARAYAARLAERYMPKAFSAVMPLLPKGLRSTMHPETFGMGVGMALESELSPFWLATLSGIVTGTGGMTLGAGLGMITGAWSAGKGVRATQAFNQFGAIGL